MVELNRLPFACVSMHYILQLSEYQEGSELKLAHGLTKRNINPDQYEKMKVGVALGIFNHDAAAGLRELIKEGIIDKQAETTAWFIDQIVAWFEIMTNRSFKSALFKNSEVSIEKLHDFIKLILSIRVKTKKGSTSKPLKPWQQGMWLSTTTILMLHISLVKEGEYTFLLTSRMTQEALDYLFSQIRSLGNVKPSASKFRSALKQITLTQAMHTPVSTSYNIDKTPNLINFVKENPCCQRTKHALNSENDKENYASPILLSETESKVV